MRWKSEKTNIVAIPDSDNRRFIELELLFQYHLQFKFHMKKPYLPLHLVIV
jgi:hypothetical protein